MTQQILANRNEKTGFTLVELIVSLAIFSVMTALLMARYGSFNQGILLTNLAYDVALTLRTAQSYGLNVKSLPKDDLNYSGDFTGTYGVHFDSSTGKNTSIIFFADTNTNSIYNDSDYKISTLNIKRGSKVDFLCAADDANICSTCNNSSCSPSALDIVFKRPDPKAIITGTGRAEEYAEIRLKSSDGATKKVVVNSVGQITVSD